MNNLSHLVELSGSQYAAKCRKFSNLDKLFEEKLDFDNFAFNAFLQYLAYGDVIHVNRMLLAAKHLNRYREMKALFSGLVAHDWESGQAPLLDRTSKASKRKLASLRRQGENAFLMAFDAPKQKNLAKPFDLNKDIETYIKKLEKKGLTRQDLINALIGSGESAGGAEIRNAA